MQLRKLSQTHRTSRDLFEFDQTGYLISDAYDRSRTFLDTVAVDGPGLWLYSPEPSLVTTVPSSRVSST
ncbi:MAG: hypothetical protein ACK5O2_11670 [Microthrixaceae bacterium]